MRCSFFVCSIVEDLMRSYQAARGLFSFLSVLAWLIIIAGGLIAFAGLQVGSGIMPRNPDAGVILALVAGAFVAVIGFVMLAMSQVGRSTVDSAEYGQQMLQLARESLEVSRQSLRHTEQMKTGFEALRTAGPERPMADYAAGLSSTEKALPSVEAKPLPAIPKADETGNGAGIDHVSPTAIEVASPLKPMSYADLAPPKDKEA
jgi:ABC-type multidrug transport system fused ATPase/permease subunit